MEYRTNSVFKTTTIILLSDLDSPARVSKFLQACSIVESFGEVDAAPTGNGICVAAIFCLFCLVARLPGVRSGRPYFPRARKVVGSIHVG